MLCDIKFRGQFGSRIHNYVIKPRKLFSVIICDFIYSGIKTQFINCIYQNSCSTSHSTKSNLNDRVKEEQTFSSHKHIFLEPQGDTSIRFTEDFLPDNTQTPHTPKIQRRNRKQGKNTFPTESDISTQNYNLPSPRCLNLKMKIQSIKNSTKAILETKALGIFIDYRDKLHQQSARD